MRAPSDYTTAYLTTADEVRAYVNSDNAIYDVQLTLFTDTHAGGLAVKNSLPDGTNDFSAYCTDCAVENNASGDVPRTASLTLTGDVAAYIDASADRVKVSIVYYNEDGTIKLGPISQGIFLFQTYVIEHFDNGESFITANLVDDVYTLTQIEFLADYAVPLGVNNLLAAQTILKMDAKGVTEGGRTPSGTVVSGGPQSHIPSPGTYTMMGVLASTVTTYNAVTGYYESADHGFGVVQYSPFDAAHCSAATFAPISPFDGRPMGGIAGQTPEWFHDSGLAMYFRPKTGEFAYPFTRTNPFPIIVDPYRDAPYPTGQIVIQPDDMHVGSSKGTITPPLSTWPYDYDGSGPWWVNSTAQPITTVSSGTISTLVGQPISDHFLLAQRVGWGVTTLITPGSYYASVTDGGSGDPSIPGELWAQPPTSIMYNVAGFGQGWDWPGGDWTITLTLSGGPTLAGTASIGCSIYERDSLGIYNLRGTLTGSPVTFDAAGDSVQIPFTATGTVSGFTPAVSSSMQFAVTLDVTDAITCDINPLGTASIYAGLDVGFPAPNLPSASTYTDFGTPASGLSPTGTGTGVPWPDTNDPGQAPSGCDEVGRNLPAGRISFPTVAATTPATITGNRKDKHLAFINTQLLAAANCYPLWVDEEGQYTTAVMPYYTDTSVPDIEWTFSNDAPPEDGYIVSCKQTVWDSDNVWNLVLEVAEPNGNGVGLFDRISNDDAGSIVSRAHQGRPITYVDQNDALTSQTAVNEAAQLAMQNGSRGIDSLECVVPMNPFFATHDVVNVKWKDQTTGTYVVDGTSFPYIVTDWKMTLRQGGQLVPTVTFTAQRVVQFT